MATKFNESDGRIFYYGVFYGVLTFVLAYNVFHITRSKASLLGGIVAFLMVAMFKAARTESAKQMAAAKKTKK